MNEQSRDYSITSVERALQILKLFVPANTPMTLMEICAQTGLHKSTALRMAYTLRQNGMLRIDEETKRYSLGLSALQMGLSALDSLSLSKTAEPLLRTLADRTGFVAHMGIFENNSVVVLSKIFPIDKACSIRLASRIGGILPIYCTGIGLLFLAQMEECEAMRLIQACDRITYTSTTEIDPERILERVRLIRSQGYTINNGEHDEGIVSVCFPIRDHTRRMVAGISLGGIREVFHRVGIERMLAETQRTATQISNELGYYA